MFTSLPFSSAQLDPFMFDVVLKSSIILALAWTATVILRRVHSSAAARHAIWSLAIVGLLALPVLAAILPPWIVTTAWAPSENAASPQIATPAWQVEQMHNQLTWNHAQEAVEPDNPGPIANQVTAIASDEPEFSTALPAARLVSQSKMNWLLAVWLIGTAIALVPICVGLLSLQSLRRRSHSVTSGPLYTALQQNAATLGLHRTVRLLQSPTRTMPMTWGLWRPTILLPENAELWSGDRLRAVLLHELSHIQRFDCLSRMLAQVGRAMYWFHPLAWLAERQIRLEQEQACDDQVLRHGVGAADYAEHLLNVLAGFRAPASASVLAMAMARKSNMERRLRCILSACPNRHPLSRPRLGVATALAIALLVSLAVLRVESTAVGVEPAAANAPENAEQKDAQDAAKGQANPIVSLRAKIAEQYVTPIDEKQILQGAIKGMIGALRDPYSDYLTPEMVAELEKQIVGTLVGIGAQLEKHENRVRIVTALSDSPALQAGLRPGDIITQIDDKPTDGIDLGEAVKRIVGQKGTVVKLKIGRAGQTVDVSVTRAPITLQTVRGFRRGADNRYEFLLDATRKIGYVQVVQFGPATAQELRTAIESLKSAGLKGLIVDLRFCPGGMLESAVETCRLMLAEGTIVSLHSRTGEPTKITANGTPILGDTPVVVLVNGQTASAAEVVAGALQDNHRALIVGTRTFGKASVQSLIKLDEGGGAIKLTTSQYRLPSGRDINKHVDAKTWGIEADEGFFIPLERAQVKTLLQRRQQRDIISNDASKPADQVAEVTAKWIEEQQADPQLAAALQALATRLESGQYAKISNLSPAQTEQFLKREDVEMRRESVLQNLEQLDRELAELKKDTAAKN